MKNFKLFIESLITESVSYNCKVCGDRLTHEEYDEDPNDEKIKCANCGNCKWEMEH